MELNSQQPAPSPLTEEEARKAHLPTIPPLARYPAAPRPGWVFKTLAEAKRFFALVASCLRVVNRRCAAAFDLADQALRHRVCSYTVPRCFH